MTLDEFRRLALASAGAPPPGASGALQALWFEARGDWEKAHEHAQRDLTRNGSWVHAYLHRKEGDESNAGYWYSRAGRTVPEESAADEWAAIARQLLAEASK